jgi:hypothetical protein
MFRTLNSCHGWLSARFGMHVKLQLRSDWKYHSVTNCLNLDKYFSKKFMNFEAREC